MFTEKQKEIITGSLLGDGTIWTNFVDPLMKWQLSQSKFDWIKMDKKSYICWYVQEFLELGVSVRTLTVKSSGMIKEISGNKEYQKYIISTRCNKIWNEIEKQWYVPRTDHSHWKRRKIIPQDIKLTPLSLCVWHMDDGYNNPKDANIELNTQSFTEKEVEFLIRRLKQDIGIDGNKKISSKKDSQYKIYIGRKSYFDFIETIKPHINWDCFKYKVNTSKYTKKQHIGETHSAAKLTEKKVKQIFTLRDDGLLQKDIAKKLNVSKANVSLVLSGNRWKHLGMNRSVVKKPRLTKEKKSQILKLHSKGLFQKDIAEQINTHQSTVSRVLKEAQYHIEQ